MEKIIELDLEANNNNNSRVRLSCTLVPTWYIYVYYSVSFERHFFSLWKTPLTHSTTTTITCQLGSLLFQELCNGVRGDREFAKYSVRMLDAASNSYSESATFIMSAKTSNRGGPVFVNSKKSSSSDIESVHNIVMNKRDFAMLWEGSLSFRSMVIG